MSGLKLKLHEFHGKLAFAAKLKLYLRSDHVGESGLKFIASLEFPELEGGFLTTGPQGRP